MKIDRLPTLTGLDVLVRDGHALVDNQRVGLVTNYTAVTRNLESIVDVLHRDERFRLTKLFSPEHGLRGVAQAGDHVGDGIDRATGLQVISLYGEYRTPNPEQLSGLDVLVYDLQDVGARHYTYTSTLEHVMKAAASLDIPVVVLDRPNPITGLNAEGKVLETGFVSFVGIHPLPTRHGLTIGELALLIAADTGLPMPTVIRCEGWDRGTWWDDTGLPFVYPSPNLPSLDSVLAYTATCIFEATNLSEGRGTTKPFEIIGAPWLDGDALAAELNARELPGVKFRPVGFMPWFSKHAGVACSGVQLHVTDRDAFRPVSSGVHLVHAITHLPGSEFAWLDGPALGMSHARLYGSTELCDMLADGSSAEEIIDRWQPALDIWIDRSREFWLYE